MRNTLFALTVLVASCALVTTANVNAQTVPAGCFKIEGGQTFCPKPEGLAPTTTPTAPATPLDQEIQQAMAKGEKVVAVMNKYSHKDATVSPIPSTDWGYGQWFLALLALLIVGGVILALVRRNRTNGHHPATGNQMTVPVTVQLNPPPPINIDLAASLRNPTPAHLAPAGTPCPNCNVPKPTQFDRFCANCGNVLPMILFALLLFGALGQTATAQTANEVWVWGKVNGIQGWLSQIVNPTPASAVTPAPKPAVSAPAPSPVRRHVAPPAPRPVVSQLTADDIKRAVMEGVKAAMPSTPPAPPAPVINPPTMMSATPNNSAPAPSGLGQQVVDRLVAVEGRQNLLASRQVELGSRLTTAEERMVTLRDNQNSDHETLAVVGAAAITDSKSNKCSAFKRLMSLGMLNEGARPPKGCKAQ